MLRFVTTQYRTSPNKVDTEARNVIRQWKKYMIHLTIRFTNLKEGERLFKCESITLFGNFTISLTESEGSKRGNRTDTFDSITF